MKNSQKGFVVPLLSVIIAILLISGVYLYSNQAVKTASSPDTQIATTSNQTLPAAAFGGVKNSEGGSNLITGDKNCGFEVTSIAANAKVNFPLVVKGNIDNTNAKARNCSWQMFEGQAGTAHLFYNYNNQGWKPIGQGVPVKVDDWTAVSTKFATALDFNNGGIGIPVGTPMKITFTAEDAAGLGKTGSIDFPIILGKASSGSRSVIQPTFPVGGETFKVGQHVTIKWKTNPVSTTFYPEGTFSAVNIQVVSNTLDKCQEYTNNGSMGTCRGYEIYSGPNAGSFDWVVPSEYPSSGTYLIRMWPDVGMETAHDISSKDFDTDGYSGFFTITR